MLFEDLSLSKSIQKAVFEEGYVAATPIQEQAIPIVLSGRDLIGCAQTGTGKTVLLRALSERGEQVVDLEVSRMGQLLESGTPPKSNPP